MRVPHRYARPTTTGASVRMRMEPRLFARLTATVTRLALAAAVAGVPVAAAQAAAPVAASAAASAPALKEKCLGCHDDPKMKAEDGKPVAVIADDFARSAHRKLDCSTCHDAALAVKHPQNPLG